MHKATIIIRIHNCLSSFIIVVESMRRYILFNIYIQNFKMIDL